MMKNDRFDRAARLLAQCSQKHGWTRGNGKCVRRRVATGAALLGTAAIGTGLVLAHNRLNVKQNIPGAPDIRSWKTETPKNKGSSPAKIFVSPSGDRFYGKMKRMGESNERFLDRSRTEALASKLYQLAGVPSVDMTIGNLNGQAVLLSKMIETANTSEEDNQSVRDGFVVDAWLANWDAPMHDNIMMSGGKPHRIDVGGALDYRARGGKKGEKGSTPFGETVGEMRSLQRKGKAADFREMDPKELQRQADNLGKIKDDDIRSLVKDGGRPDLAEVLIARKNYIVDRFGGR
jgi:hypothetical protein